MLAFLLLSCSKNSEIVINDDLENEMIIDKDSISINSRPLLGIWQWVMSTGGIANQTITPANSGEEQELIITENQFTFSGTDIMTDSFDYIIELDKSIFSIDSIELIKLPSYGWFSYQLDEVTLILKEEIYDGYTHHYVKK